MPAPVGPNQAAASYIAVKSVAESLAVSTRTVSRMCESGDMPAYKIGGQWRIRQDEFAKWMKGNRNEKWLLSISVETPIGSVFNGAGRKSGSRLARLLSEKPENISRNCKSNTAG